MKRQRMFLFGLVVLLGGTTAISIAEPRKAKPVDQVPVSDPGIVAGVAVGPSVESLPGNLDFEPPVLFISSIPLQIEQNTSTRVVFGAGNGAVLDVFSFSVTGYSMPNALAWNCGAANSDGTVPALPEILLFNPPVQRVSMLIGDGVNPGMDGGLVALDGMFNVLDSDFVVLGAAMQPVSVSSASTGIQFAAILGPCIMVADNIVYN